MEEQKIKELNEKIATLLREYGVDIRVGHSLNFVPTEVKTEVKEVLPAVEENINKEEK